MPQRAVGSASRKVANLKNNLQGGDGEGWVKEGCSKRIENVDL